MKKEIFENAVGTKVTEEEFEVLQVVLAYHPEVLNFNQLVELYEEGMEVVRSKYKKANSIKEITLKIEKLKEEIYDLEDELYNLSN